MTKIIYVFCIFLITINISKAEKINFIGQNISGIAKLDYQTTVDLPLGNWIVSNIVKRIQISLSGDFVDKNMTFKKVTLTQLKDNKIIAFLNITFSLGDLGDVEGGGILLDNNSCDEYRGKNTNYHLSKLKKRAKTHILSGVCNSIFVSSESPDPDNMQYLLENNIDLPQSLLTIANIFFSINNRLELEFIYNPEMNGIKSPPVNWSVYNIDQYEANKSFMDKAIYQSQLVVKNNEKKLKKRKSIDLTFYNELY